MGTKYISIAATIVSIIISIGAVVIAVENRYEKVNDSIERDEATLEHTDKLAKTVLKGIWEAKLDTTNLELQYLYLKPESEWNSTEKQQYDFLIRKRNHFEKNLGY